jgi:hypothetical protein
MEDDVSTRIDPVTDHMQLIQFADTNRDALLKLTICDQPEVVPI